MMSTEAAPEKAPPVTTSVISERHIFRPAKGKISRFIFTSAQDGTEVFLPFWENLQRFAKYVNAEIFVGGYTYNKSLFEDHSKKRASFSTEVAPFMCNTRVNIDGQIVFCGEINTRPTNVNPLTGFETYTRSASGIFPHPRVVLQTVATMANAPAKQIMTTGTVTKPNYIALNPGFRAEFHHVIGALLVEIDGDGDIFWRHIISDRDGSFQDLSLFVDAKGNISRRRVEAITWGDIHAEVLDDNVREGCWDADGMLDKLRPAYQFFHDTIDFTARNHHRTGDPYHLFRQWLNRSDSVEEALTDAGRFLKRASRGWCQGVVVESNHDQALSRWLREADYKTDPANATFFLQLQLAKYKAIESENEDRFFLFEYAMRRCGAPDDLIFVRETDSFKICEHRGGIECALHGHKGANGAKGHFRAFAKMGPKANVGHTHSPAIFEGIYQAGTSSKLDLEYNRGGLSSWAHAHIVTYPNGKRTIVTMRGPKWRAQ